MTSLSKRMAAAYNQIVDAYASRNHASMADNLVALAQQLISEAGSNAHILDVGCGTGRDIAWLEAQGVTVTGIDLSAGMLAYARRCVISPLVQMNMQRLAFQTGQFDGVWCCASLLHLPKQVAPEALKEMHRVLKTQHLLALSVQAGAGEGWEDGYVKGVRRFFARYTVEELSALLAHSGFAVREVSSSQAGARNWLSLMCLAR